MGQTTDTWTYDAWGETTSRTGVTENDYLYAGERFDRTTELYQLRARYLDPKTGTFLSLDPYQGNRHDPASLHKYMYANANPVNNVDPTGMFSLGETSSSLYVLNIMDGTVGLNYALIFQMMMGAGSAIRLSYSIVDMVTAFFITHNAETFLHAAANGTLAFVDLYGFCQYGTIVQLLVKGLAVYDANNSIKAFRKAVDDGNVAGILMSSLSFVLDVATLFSSCFDGDTPVATETGFRRIDEIRAGDRVWSYNVETGERALKVVKEVFVRENDELLHIETSRGAIDATTDHPFYVVSKGWVAAGDLAVGDSIQAISGDAGVVTGLELEKLDKPISVYNLDVEDFHSYFVADGVLVHNRCGYENHHSIPKYLGGDPNQTLTELPAEVHRRIHAAIDRLADGKFARRLGGKYFKELIKTDPTFKNKVVDALTKIYKKEKNPRLMMDFLKNVEKYLNSHLRDIRESEVLVANLLFRIQRFIFI